MGAAVASELRIKNNYWMKSSRIIIKAEICVICRSQKLRQITQTWGLNNSSYPTRTKINKINNDFVFANLSVEEAICIFPLWHKQYKLVWSHKVVYKCFQYTNKLHHNVIYVFSVLYDDVITPYLGNYQMDMTISSTTLNQSKLFNYFQ